MQITDLRTRSLLPRKWKNIWKGSWYQEVIEEIPKNDSFIVLKIIIKETGGLELGTRVEDDIGYVRNLR